MIKIDLRICTWVWLAFLEHVQTDILLMFFELKLYVFFSAIGQRQHFTSAFRQYAYGYWSLHQ
jgi:hypothetical protein